MALIISNNEATQLDTLYRLLSLIWEDTHFKSVRRVHKVNKLWQQFEEQMESFVCKDIPFVNESSDHSGTKQYREDPWIVISETDTGRIDTVIHYLLCVWDNVLQNSIEREFEQKDTHNEHFDDFGSITYDDVPW